MDSWPLGDRYGADTRWYFCFQKNFLNFEENKIKKMRLG